MKEIRLVKRERHWCVLMPSGLLAYSSTAYAKAVGVHEYLTQRRKAFEAEGLRPVDASATHAA